MNLESYRDEIKLRLTGYMIEMEITDDTLDKIINAAFREVQRYIDSTKLITIPYEKCIDMSPYKVSSVSRVYRTEGTTGASATEKQPMDPLYAAQWQFLSGTGNLYNFNNYVQNYLAWNTALQMRNTTSTDLAHFYDKSADKLYINVSTGMPEQITIEYIPKYDDVSEIVSDYWIDILMRLAIALTKVTLGRIRSRYTISNALWTQDGEAILAEGNAELEALRTALEASTQLVYPID